MNIGKLMRVPVREAFPHEAHDFTVWLEANIETLAETLGLDLTVLEREKAVGTFIVDLFCEDRNGRHIIVENQLERTDHDHLGKVLTYLVNLEAKVAIWVTPEVRPEHQRVIDWLNEATSAEFAFYLVRLEAVRINDSAIAPLFTVLAGPDEQTREIGETKKELADRHLHRQEFWKQLLERSKGRTNLFAGRAPTTDYWLSTGSGRSGITFNYDILINGAGTELVIDVGDQATNKAIFDELATQRQEIEEEFGETLNWRRLDDKRSSIISWRIFDQGSLYETESWPALQERLINAMIRFDKALRQRIARLRV